MSSFRDFIPFELRMLSAALAITYVVDQTELFLKTSQDLQSSNAY